MAKNKRKGKSRLSKWIDDYAKSLPAEVHRGYYDDEALGAIAAEGLSFVLERFSFTVSFVEDAGHDITMDLCAYPLSRDDEYGQTYIRPESFAVTGAGDARFYTVQYCNKMLRDKIK